MITNVMLVLSYFPASSAVFRTILFLVIALLATSSHKIGFAQTKEQNSTSISQAPAESASSDGRPQIKTETTDEEKTGTANGPIDAKTKLLADMHLLLTLSRELQAEAAKSTPNTFSLRMVKKSEEIQRLAATVRVELAKQQ